MTTEKKMTRIIIIETTEGTVTGKGTIGKGVETGIGIATGGILGMKDPKTGIEMIGPITIKTKTAPDRGPGQETAHHHLSG